MGAIEDPAHVVLKVTSEELMLLCEALDSHVYWQLSDIRYRNDGYVREPGSDDAAAVDAIRGANELEEKLRMTAREIGLPA